MNVELEEDIDLFHSEPGSETPTNLYYNILFCTVVTNVQVHKFHPLYLTMYINAMIHFHGHLLVLTISLGPTENR